MQIKLIVVVVVVFMIWTRSVQDLNTFTSFLNDIHPTIFINMFAPKWTRGSHNLARFPSWDPCITPGYWALYSNVLPTSGSFFRSLFYAFMPRGHIYLRFLCAIPVFVAEHGLGSWRYPSLCFGSRSPGCDTSFELPFIAWVAFRLFLRRVSPSGCFHGVCRLPVSHFSVCRL